MQFIHHIHFPKFNHYTVDHLSSLNLGACARVMVVILCVYSVKLSANIYEMISAIPTVTNKGIIRHYYCTKYMVKINIIDK